MESQGVTSNVYVSLPRHLVPVRIVKRLNRFVVEVHPDRPRSDRDDTPSMTLHLPNSGRMEELLTRGALGLAVMDGGGERRTAGTLLLVRYLGKWVSVDSRIPNRLFERGLVNEGLEPFLGYDTWRSEAPWGKGRIDFLLSSPGTPDFLVETKSCNLVEDGLALFPDAPTERGARHLAELAEAAKAGWRAAVVWFVQREDAQRLAPHRKADPHFADSLDRAKAVGVETYAYRCRVEPEGISVLAPIPVE